MRLQLLALQFGSVRIVLIACLQCCHRKIVYKTI
jgi:hypothetical protein